jgi:hypothetical protein
MPDNIRLVYGVSSKMSFLAAFLSAISRVSVVCLGPVIGSYSLCEVGMRAASRNRGSAFCIGIRTTYTKKPLLDVAFVSHAAQFVGSRIGFPVAADVESDRLYFGNFIISRNMKKISAMEGVKPLLKVLLNL